MSRRVPPHDLEAEASVLGACLTSAQALDDILGVGITPHAFYAPAHATMFAAMTALHDQPAPVDVVSLAAKLESTGKLEAVGGRAAINGLLLATTVHPIHHAQVVAGYARSRRVIAAADAVVDAGYTGDQEALTDALILLDAGAPPAVVEPPVEASALVAEERAPDWVIENLLARLEVALIVAEPGAGKSTLMRQIAACVASGLHPWDRRPITPRTTISFDFQDPPGPAIRATRDAIASAGESYRRRWFVELRQEGIDLTNPRDQAWFEGKIAAVDADLVLAGPLYNMLRGAPGRSKQSEETAELAGRFLIDLLVRRDCALIVEAHAPHGEEMRVRGSKYWEDWAAFGLSLKQGDSVAERRLLTVDRFRGDREIGRQWPKSFAEGRGRWKWDAVGIPPVAPPPPRWHEDEIF